MHAIEVPRNEWQPFLHGFAAAHRDWLIDVRLTQSGGDRANLYQLPLADIQLDEQEPEHPAITVQAVQEGGFSASQTLMGVECVRLFKGGDGVEHAIALETAHGAELWVELLSP